MKGKSRSWFLKVYVLATLSDPSDPYLLIFMAYVSETQWLTLTKQNTEKVMGHHIWYRWQTPQLLSWGTSPDCTTQEEPFKRGTKSNPHTHDLMNNLGSRFLTLPVSLGWVQGICQELHFNLSLWRDSGLETLTIKNTADSLTHGTCEMTCLLVCC